MGIRDWFRNIKNRFTQKKLPEAQTIQENSFSPNIYSFTGRNRDEQIMINQIEKNQSFRHRDGKETDLYVAKIARFEIGDKAVFDKEICFEIPREMDLNLLKQSGHLRQLLNNVMAQNLSYYQSNYIGRLDINQYTGEYAILPPSATVKNYVDQNLTSKIQTRIQEQRKMQEQRHLQEQELLKRVTQNAHQNNDDLKRREENMFQQRIDNPKFQKAMNNNNFQCHDAYSGRIIDLENVNCLQSIQYETGQVSYIYQGAVTYSNKIDDVRLLGLGQQVCFELPMPIEQITQYAQSNPEYARIMGAMLSNNNLESQKKSQGYNPLTYVGSIWQNQQGNLQIYNNPPQYVNNLINTYKNYGVQQNNNENRQNNKQNDFREF